MSHTCLLRDLRARKKQLLTALAPHGFELVILEDPGSAVSLGSGTACIWTVLRGTLLATSERSWQLGSRRTLTWPDGPIQLQAGRNTLAIGLVAPVDSWPKLTARFPDPFLLRQATYSRTVLKAKIALYRALQSSPKDVGHNLHRLLHQIQLSHLGEPEFEAYLANSPGRTRLAKLRTLARLLRVRHEIETQQSYRLSVSSLTPQSDYCYTTLIRLYSRVFGVTPKQHLIDMRLERAWRLAAEGKLSVLDITSEAGFESQSAFCRAFKNRFGMTATEVSQKTCFVL